MGQLPFFISLFNFLRKAPFYPDRKSYLRYFTWFFRGNAYPYM